jgi:tetratricopeptide (TPR) repeat protein
LPLKPSQYPAADSLTRFTRGFGMARSGDLAGAKAEIEAIKTLRATLEKANQPYWAARSEEQILTISAWIALKEGARDQAIKFMRAAADGEDGSIKSVAMENRLYPFRELLGELLLDMGQPAEALKEFETALAQTPNRYRAFLGIASGPRHARPKRSLATNKRLADDASHGVGRSVRRIGCGRRVVRDERLGTDKPGQWPYRIGRNNRHARSLADLYDDDPNWS